MTVYKFRYFDAKGAGEIARLMFAAAGVPYEDIRYTPEKWAEFKTQTPLGQLPVLEVDGGRMITQSIPIAVGLGISFGMHGSNNIDRFHVDQVVASAAELRVAFGKVATEKDETKKAELLKEFKTETIPKWIKVFEKFLSDSKIGYFASEKLTVADVVVFDILERFSDEHAQIFKDAPRLKKNYDLVRSNPGISSWLQKRPKTEN